MLAKIVLLLRENALWVNLPLREQLLICCYNMCGEWYEELNKHWTASIVEFSCVSFRVIIWNNERPSLMNHLAPYLPKGIQKK